MSDSQFWLLNQFRHEIQNIRVFNLHNFKDNELSEILFTLKPEGHFTLVLTRLGNILCVYYMYIIYIVYVCMLCNSKVIF